MDLLIDTHVFLWWEGESESLPRRVRQTIESPANRVCVSAASVWEIAIKRKLGKLDFEGPVTAAIQRSGFVDLAVTAFDAETAGQFDWEHRDPFDRLIFAQCLNGGLTLVTADALLKSRGAPIIWAR